MQSSDNHVSNAVSPIPDGHADADAGDSSITLGCSESLDNDHYQSRKPKWWAQLARRRGTKAQRQAIQRMTECGYCIPKEILTDFSRMNNRSQKSACSTSMIPEDEKTDQWRRGWWNRVLSVRDVHDDSTECVHDISIVTNEQNRKYAHKFLEMLAFRNILTAREYKHIWLEIGFGNGANMFANAKNHPDNLYMGSEIHQPGTGILAQTIEVGLTKDNPVENIRILPGDGIKLLYHLPDNYLDAILITFPDPWPKESHACWRVIQTEIIQEIRRVLRYAGCVFVATDAECFNSWTHEIFSRELEAWMEVKPCPPREEWLPIISYYEEKGLNEGRHTMLQSWKTL